GRSRPVRGAAAVGVPRPSLDACARLSPCTWRSSTSGGWWRRSTTPASTTSATASPGATRCPSPAPGTVWRLQDEAGNATGIQVTDDPLYIVNLTVWESIETLADFAY